MMAKKVQLFTGLRFDLHRELRLQKTSVFFYKKKKYMWFENKLIKTNKQMN